MKGTGAMILLSAKARRLVEQAVSRLPNPRERSAWEEWSRTHEKIKQWDTTAIEEVDGMPEYVAAIAAAALSTLAESLQKEILSATLDEDEIVQIDNNLAYIRSIEKTLTQRPH
jgi:hypothetical protein